MSDLRIYHLKTCDTCRKAIKALRAADRTLTLIDVRADGLSPDAIDMIIASAGWEAALNRRSTTWRGLTDVEKTGLDDANARDLIATHPTLLKRPVITDGDALTVGWTKAVQSEWLGEA